MVIEVNTKQKTYPVYLERGILKKAAQLTGSRHRVFMISDDGVDERWQSCLKEQFPNAPMHIFPHGEASKNITVWQNILEDMLAQHISRNDTVIALGGGVVGDLAGFAAASYMRGIRYINIPTTTLAQIDSSIGGKTAVNLAGVKNCVGAFWQPDMVLIDPETLQTLPPRHYQNGMAEAVKAGMIKDEQLFEIFEKDDWNDHIDEIIRRSLMIKKEIVEKDEKEAGERKLLNFGHTFGHAFESCYGMNRYYHGECVAMGMMAVLENPTVKQRLKAVLERLQLPVYADIDPSLLTQYIRNDKKADHDSVTIVQVHTIGAAILEEWTMQDIERRSGL